MPHELNKKKKLRICIFLCTSFGPIWVIFLITLWHMVQNRFSTTIDIHLCSSLIEVRHKDTFPNIKCIKRTLWSLFSGEQLESYILTWILVKSSQHRSIANKSIKYYNVYAPLPLVNQKKGSILCDSVQPISQITSERNWTMKLLYAAYFPTSCHVFNHFNNFFVIEQNSDSFEEFTCFQDTPEFHATEIDLFIVGRFYSFLFWYLNFILIWDWWL